MSQRRVVKLPDGNTLTFLMVSDEEFEAICDELEATAEAGELPWEDREVLESARRERRLPKMPRGCRTERLFSRLEVETTYLSVVVADNVISASAPGCRVISSFEEVLA
jgi:hypothetical protein